MVVLNWKAGGPGYDSGSDPCWSGHSNVLGDYPFPQHLAILHSSIQGGHWCCYSGRILSLSPAAEFEQAPLKCLKILHWRSCWNLTISWWGRAAIPQRQLVLQKLLLQADAIPPLQFVFKDDHMVMSVHKLKSDVAWRRHDPSHNTARSHFRYYHRIFLQVSLQLSAQSMLAAYPSLSSKN